ncbi:MAG: hypothetical protein IJV15_04260 [Lachnospiraceae bacterium]|nr:hypothetical protein [Lachnospiraceae bacterium]
MAKKKKLGDIVEIPLGNGENAYARLYKEGNLGIFVGRYHNYDEVPPNVDFYRFIGVYRSELSKLQVVGSRPFENGEDNWAPDKVIVDAITLKGRLYHHGEIIECSYNECKDLEVCAVWELHHLIDMLNGETKWDDSLKRPKDI